MDLSIVVSSFNRAGDLTRFLDSLGRMEVPGRQTWEVIVVDNNSTDETRQVVERAATGCEDQVRYLFEPRQGKSFALNTALSRVRGRIVAFTDDDAIVRPDWVRSIIDFFDRHPDAVCVGGKVELFNPADADEVALARRVAEQGIAFVPFGPLGGGRGTARDEEYAAVARRHRATIAQVALAHMLALSPNTLAIPGTGSLTHLEENIEAASICLSPQEFHSLAAG